MPPCLRAATSVPEAGRRAREAGKRRKFDRTLYTAVAPYPWQGQKITRGYNFHEQLDSVGLVHMNGRVYDPEIGRRFMSPDIAIQDATNLQALNGYTYVWNNPLSFTDSSGFFLSGLFKSIGNFFRSVFRAIGQVFKAILNSQIGRALIQIAACSFGGPACVAASGILTLATGGSIGQALKSMAMTFVSVATWTAVGQFLHPIVKTGGLAGQAISVGTHAVVGGALSVAQGGSFLEGFAAGGIGDIGSFAGFDLVGSGEDGLFARTAIAASMGGLSSEITGGKFSNGAITAAFGHLFNAERALTPAEKDAARTEFPEGLDVDALRITYDITWSDAAYTPGNTMNFPAFMAACKDFTTCSDGRYVLWFIHEVTHTWQFQNNINPVAGHIFSKDIFKFGDYLTLDEYHKILLS